MASLLPSALARIDALRAQIDALRPRDPDALGRAVQRLRLEWTYHSNAIEGNSLDYGETRALLMHGVTAHGKPLKDHLDIQRHRAVIEYLEAMVRENEPLTLAVVREMHRMLMGDTYDVKAQTPDGGWITREETGGAYKTHSNHVVTRTGETHYYATPEETPARMTDLLDACTRLQAEVEAGETHPLVAAATLHHGLVEIHPFADGNGRLARVLMNLLLMRAGYPPAVLRTEHRDAYYGALAEADAGSLDAFAVFVAEELAETMALYLRALRGEPDPDAFSRRVAIMRREMESEAPRVFDAEIKARVGQAFIVPLFEKIDVGFSKLSDLFMRSERNIEMVDSSMYPGDTRLESGLWTTVSKSWSAQELRSNPDISVYASMDINARASVMRLNVSGLDMPERTFSASQLPGASEASALADEMLTKLADRVEALWRREEE